jgi:hypothetical protein
MMVLGGTGRHEHGDEQRGGHVGQRVGDALAAADPDEDRLLPLAADVDFLFHAVALGGEGFDGLLLDALVGGHGTPSGPSILSPDPLRRWLTTSPPGLSLVHTPTQQPCARL